MWNAFFEGNLFDNEQAKIYTPPPSALVTLKELLIFCLIH